MFLSFISLSQNYIPKLELKKKNLVPPMLVIPTSNTSLQNINEVNIVCKVHY